MRALARSAHSTRDATRLGTFRCPASRAPADAPNPPPPAPRPPPSHTQVANEVLFLGDEPVA